MHSTAEVGPADDVVARTCPASCAESYDVAMKTFDENELNQLTAIIGSIEQAAKEIQSLRGADPAHSRAKSIIMNVNALYQMIQAGDTPK